MRNDKQWGVRCLAAGLLSGLLSLAGQAQPTPAPDTVGTVSEARLRHILRRSITLQGLLEVPAPERQQLLRWAAPLGASFAGRVGGRWVTLYSDASEQAWHDSTRRAVAQLKAQQPGLVVQGAVFEIVYPSVNNLTVPNRLRAEFGEDTLHPARRHFRLDAMMYPGYFAAHDSAHYRLDAQPPGQAPGVPDMSQRETQLWFTFCATRQLAAGCEAIHFGQVELMDDRDPGHHAWWSMLARVRRYARTCNRGFVLCDAHTLGQYYDPDPARPLPDSVRQLLFDFHATPLRPTEVDTLRAGQHGARLDYQPLAGPGGSLYGRSAGGRAPSGWRCPHLPGLVEFDNFGSAVPGRPGQPPFVWGLDEISWFATQPAAYRAQWLVYAAARVQQLDSVVYLEMPGLRVVRVPGQPAYNYRADLDGLGPLMQRIWRGETAAQAAALLLTGPPAPPEAAREP